MDKKNNYQMLMTSSSAVDGYKSSDENRLSCSFSQLLSGYAISFEEVAEDKAHIHTLIKIYQNDDDVKVTVKRSGAVESVMNFEKNRITDFKYKTSVGTLPLFLKTGEINISRDKERFLLALSYSLYQEVGESEKMLSENEFTICIFL
ncbi:MAG: DUF1934 domain-containing protein [Lachnospiraceae bacterium]|nr:DUF1934 domain-containing protein [Lachnospiraceae bacterium]